jgi:hypothetical protein
MERVICRKCGMHKQNGTPGAPCESCGAVLYAWPKGVIPGVSAEEGKYDNELEEIFAKLRAPRLALLFIAGGPKGDGFSVCGEAALVSEIPRILRQVAKNIEKQIERVREQTRYTN